MAASCWNSIHQPNTQRQFHSLYNMFSLTNMPSTASVVSAYGTFATSAMLVRTMYADVQRMADQLIPRGLQEKVLSKLGGIFGRFSDQFTIFIDETNGGYDNEIYHSSEIYLSERITPSVELIKVFQSAGEKSLSVTVNKGQKIIDTFEGIQLIWEFICFETETKEGRSFQLSFETETNEGRSFKLSFQKRYKDKVLETFLPYVAERAKAIKESKKIVKLHSLNGSRRPINLDHPSTFDTLAMDPVLKKELMDDLDRFLKRREFYRGVGKAWKRGYLLYGPPGTGKSSLIAAIANYLKFDIYDMELTSVRRNSDLRQLLLSTGNRSILVIEDIDCSIDLENRQPGGNIKNDSELTLSGLLNFVDGLWSSCGQEKIFIFTTNYKEKLDPALLRPGRMDKHIHMSFLTPCAFKTLAINYLKIESHHLFTQIEELLKELEVTPAEVAEELMKSADDADDADTALEGLIEFLEKKKKNMKIKVEEELKEVNTEQEKESEKVEKEDNKKRKTTNKNKKKMTKTKRAKNRK